MVSRKNRGTITVVVQNVGSAVALDVVVDLVCDGLTVSDLPSERPPMLNAYCLQWIELFDDSILLCYR